MKIDIPFDVGDPVLVIAWNQHDGYWITTKRFDYTLIEEFLNGRVFSKSKNAELKLEELMNDSIY